MPTELPTLITHEITRVNPDVCDINLCCARLRFADGGGQIIDGVYISDPAKLRDLLFEWLAGHVKAAVAGVAPGKHITS